MLAFDIAEPRLSFETALPAERVNYIVYYPHIAISGDGEWLVWNEARVSCRQSDGTIASYCYSVAALVPGGWVCE